MISRVYYVVKSNLHYYPPCVSEIQILKDLGVDVTVIYGSSDEKVIGILKSRGIDCIQLSDPRGKFPGKLDKINNWLSFRRNLKKYIKTIDLDNSVLWFGNAETLLPMLGCLNNRVKYIISYLELLDHRMMRIWLLSGLSRKALAVTTCEETRSYIMQYWFKLKQLPYTLPNKPYAVSVKKAQEPTTEKGKAILNAVQGRKYIIYQGIFQNVEYLETIAQVLKDYYPDYCFVMMGIDRRGVVERIKQINPNTIYSDYIPAPLHLEVTSNAHIGLLFYDPDSLNKAFCAPNKIFEYSCFGLPIIGNSIPGLSNTIGRANAGICTKFDYEKIRLAIGKILDNYEYYSQNAYAFFDSVRNEDTTELILKDLNIRYQVK